MIKVLSMSFNLLKRTAWITTIATMSCWMMPAAAELSVNNSQSVALSKNASESQYFTESIRLMKNPEEFYLFRKLNIEQYLITDSNDDVQKKYKALDVVFEFATVEGSLYGYSNGSLIDKVFIRDKEDAEITLTLPKHIDSKLIDMPELTINNYGKPVEIARLSTFSELQNNVNFLSSVDGAGIIDTRTGSLVVLVYNSNKVDISGAIAIRNKIYNYNVILPSSGWHWIRYMQKDNIYTATRVDRRDIDPIIYAR